MPYLPTKTHSRELDILSFFLISHLKIALTWLCLSGMTYESRVCCCLAFRMEWGCVTWQKTNTCKWTSRCDTFLPPATSEAQKHLSNFCNLLLTYIYIYILWVLLVAAFDLSACFWHKSRVGQSFGLLGSMKPCGHTVWHRCRQFPFRWSI